jgi:hypothetical protein
VVDNLPDFLKTVPRRRANIENNCVKIVKVILLDNLQSSFCVRCFLHCENVVELYNVLKLNVLLIINQQNTRFDLTQFVRYAKVDTVRRTWGLWLKMP